MNRRLENRDPSQFVAEVQLEAAAVECTVEDISEGGARLRFKSKPQLPATFEVLLPLFGDVKDRRAAELRWAAGTAVGVRFLMARDMSSERASSFAEHIGWLN